jgi:hypothetical protein
MALLRRYGILLALVCLWQASLALRCLKQQDPLVISSTQDAAQLADLVDCENGTFNAVWSGDVKVLRTITVGAGTLLKLAAKKDNTAIVNGSNTTQLFQVKGGTLQLYGLHLYASYSLNGSATLHAEQGSVVTMEDCVVSDNSGTLGAASIDGNSSMTLTRCKLSRNTARLAAGRDGSGGCVNIAENSLLVVTDSVITNNTAENIAGAFLIGGQLRLSNSLLANNTAITGGVIDGGLRSNMTISNCTFAQNSATEYAGAVYTRGSTQLYNSLFLKNKALIGGGYLMGPNNSTAALGAVQNCTYIGNQAAYGGAVANLAFYAPKNAMTITDSTFYSNFAADAGGVLWGFVGSTTAIKNSTFSSNGANAGGAISANGILTVTDCSFDRHTAVTVGGVIQGAAGSYVTVSNSTFTHGTATSGAAIYSVNKLSVAHCTFDNHTATVAGGAIYSAIGSNTTIKNSTFTSGTAASGAAVYSQAVMTIDSCAFTTNTANTAGGSVYCDACALTTSSSTFSNNNCTNGDGGAMYIKGVATISNSNFTANDAIAHGGAIVVSNSTDTQTLQLSNIQFLQNTAGRAGAAIFNNGAYIDTSIEVDSSTSFQQNTAVCCYAQGIGSAVTSSSIDNSTCQDIDSGGERGAECCVNGQYTDGQHCITCSDRFNCEALGTTTATLPLRPGYWRVDLQTQSVLECWESSACSGGNAISSVQEYCADGYTGPCKYYYYV